MGSSPVAVFFLSDVCRTGAKEAVEELRSLGIKTVMLTGDCQGAAQLAQEQLGGGLEVIRAELLPEDKASIIKELQKEGPTAMIGDGLNDAPALATADVGISMGISGSALATESGDVVLMTNDIQRVPKALRIARRVKRKIIENVILSISTKAAIIGLAIAGHPLVWAAVLSDVGTCLLVIFNSMLLLRGTPVSKSHAHVHKKQPMSSCCDEKSQKLHSCSSKEHDHSKHNHPCSGDRDEDHDLESQHQHKHGDSCGTKRCTSSTKGHGHSAHSHPCNGDRSKDDECCGKVDPHDLERGTKKCSSSTTEHGHNARSHSCNGHRDVVDHHDLESQNQHKHGDSCGTKKCSSSTKEHGHNAHTHPHHDHDPKPHSHGSSCGTEKCSSSIKEHAHETHCDIKHDHEHKHGCSNTGHECHQHNCSTASAKHCLGDESEDQDRGGHFKEGGYGVGGVGCEGSDTGCNGGSKKVHRGCCDSFRRECCIRRSGHFEANLRGGLSEIVID